jgi:hypothetical protein
VQGGKENGRFLYFLSHTAIASFSLPFGVKKVSKEIKGKILVLATGFLTIGTER